MTDILETLQQAQVSNPGQALLQDTPSAGDGPEKLFAQGLDLDAVRLLAYTLPVRRAIWWGCLCAWHARNQAWPRPQEQALTAAVEWVVQPTAENSRSAQAASEAAGLDNAAGCVARAAGTIGPLSELKPATQGVKLALAARAVQGAALYAHAERQRTEADFSYRQLAALGLQVAKGDVLWDQPAVQRRSS